MTDFADRREQAAPSVAGAQALVAGVITQHLRTTPPGVTGNGMIVAVSPLLVVAAGQLVQPMAILPAPLLDYAWTGVGREVLEDPILAEFIAPIIARLWDVGDELEGVLGEIHALYVSDGAPMRAWPGEQVAGVRLASLLLADVLRKACMDLEFREIAATYGFGRDADLAAAAAKIEAGRAYEQACIMEAMKS